MSKLVLLLRLYKSSVGLSVVFAKGSPVYNKLCSLISVGNNLIESMAVSRSKGYLFGRTWEITTGLYFQMLQELWQIVSFSEGVRMAIDVRMNQFKAGYLLLQHRKDP